jgi:threonyl-tRNA synthetase
LHRYERSGVTSGLTRVRSFAQDDGHIFCTEEQIGSEVRALIEMYFAVYRTFGFDEIKVNFSTRPEKSIGSAELWEHAEAALKEALEANLGVGGYIVSAGDGAFYGPKIDFQLKDALGRWWQLGTIQLDYQMPRAFELEYVAADSSFPRPVMIHRAMLGSLERFLGILIEHTAGAFPMWLAPVQVKVLPVSEKTLDYARGVAAELTAGGLRVELDESNEKLGYKIRQAQLEKVPYMLVTGAKEAEQGSVAVRLRSGEDLGAIPVAGLLPRLVAQASRRSAVLPEAS